MRWSAIRALMMLSVIVSAIPTFSVVAESAIVPAHRGPFAAAGPAITTSEVDSGIGQAIGFEGEWDPADLDLVLDTLNTLSSALGTERLACLIREALRTGSDGRETHLTSVRDARTGHPPAAWDLARGRIVLRDSFFDVAYMEANHRWIVLSVWGATAPEEITTQHAVLMHELGHVLFDGLEAERSAGQAGTPSLAAQYAETIDLRHWPHQQSSPKENVVTEIALWALSIARPETIEHFRATALIPALMAEGVRGR